ncbi:MAG TPA: hypothetical protein VF791_02815 [Pyrinomonadaceae bacterium]
MKTYAHTIRYAVAGLALCGTLFVSGTQLAASAQEGDKPKAQSKSRGQRDLFDQYKPPVKPKKVAANGATPVPVPSIQERIEKYKAAKVIAMNQLRPAPKPTTALLLSEMQVIGIFRTPRGYAAMVEATPIKLSYVIYPGETFFDGQLVAIEEDRLVFRHETRWSDGKVEKSVENKPLRQQNAVTDSMAASRSANNNGAAADPQASGDVKSPAPEKQ